MRPTVLIRLRAAAGVLFCLVGLAAVPVVLTRFGGLPNANSIRQAIDLHYLPPRLALQVAAAIGWVTFAYLLGWSATEVGYALARRPASGRAAPALIRPVTSRLAALALVSIGRLSLPLPTHVGLPVVPAAATASAPVDLAAVTVPGPVAQHHLVVAGDNLWDLALDHYGDGEEWPRIWDANRADVADPYDLPIGVVLVIPPSEGPSSELYIVKPGDSLWSIADARLGEGTDWPMLWKANEDRPEPEGAELADPSLILPGWQITIPTGASPHEGAGDATGGLSAPVDSGQTTAAAPQPAAPGPTPATTRPPPALEVGPPDSGAPSVPHASHQPQNARASGTDGTHTGVRSRDARAPMAGALGAAGTLLAVGISRAVWRRRRRRDLRLGAAAAPPPPPTDLDELRAELAITADVDQVELLRRALRDSASFLAASQSEERIRLVQVVGRRVEVLLSRPVLPAPPGWRPEASGSAWVLEDNPDRDWSDVISDDACPCPAVVSLGAPDGGSQLYLDLEAEGVLSIVGDRAATADLARSWVLELTTSPLAAGTSVLVVGEGLLEPSEAWERVRLATAWADVADEVTAWVEQSTALLAANRWPNPPAGRVQSRRAEDLGHLVVVLAAGSTQDERFDAACESVRSAHPSVSLILVGGDLVGATRIEVGGGQLVVPSLGLSCLAQSVSSETAEEVSELMEDASHVPAQLELVPRPVRPSGVTLSSPGEDYHDPDFEVLVRMLGDICVVGGAKPLTPQQTAVCAYVALHAPVTSEAVEDAVWVAPTENRHKRLANTISDCRTALGPLHLPIATDGRYRVGAQVRTDLEMFERRVTYAAQQEGAAAAKTLRGALELVEGPVFTYRNADRASFVWVDLESWHSDWERKVMALMEDLGGRYLELDDIDSALWTGERGRQVSKTDPGPRRLLMKAHLAGGDADAAVAEFESYKSALEALDLDEVDADLMNLYERARRARGSAAS